MKYVLKHCEDSQVEVVITFDEKDVEGAKKPAMEKIAAKLDVKGFRKGKIPPHLASKYISDEELLNGIVNNLIPAGYKHFLENEKEINILLRPDVEVTEASLTQVVAKYLLVVRPEVEISNYRDIEIRIDPILITETDIDAKVKELQDKNAELVTSDQPIAEGDTVNFNFEGFIDGTPFEGGKAENFDLVIGSKQFIPGFEDNMIGLVAGQEKDIDVTFPEEYHEHLAGKPAVFKVVINAVKKKNVPEANDDLALEENIEGVNNYEQLRDHLASQLRQTKNEEAEATAFNKLLQTIVDNSKVKVPSKIVDLGVENQLENLKKHLEQQGANFEQYLQYTNKTIEDVKNEIREKEEKNLERSFIFNKIASSNDIKITQEDIDAEYEKLTIQSNMKLAEVKKALKGREEELNERIYVDKLYAFIKSVNKIVH